MDIKNLKRDTARIEGGEWIGDIPGMGELRLRVRGIGSTTYQAAVSRMSRAAPREDRLRDNSLKPAASMRITGRALQEAILLEWDGLESDGKPLAFDKELALEWLTDPDFRSFFDAVIYAANVVENGRASTTEDLEKN